MIFASPVFLIIFLPIVLLAYYIPAVDIDKTGDMTLLYDMGCLIAVDYYNSNPYSAYSYGDQPLMIVENEDIIDNDLHILLIHDSIWDFR